MSRIDDSQVLDLLSSLVDKSLVVYEEDAQGQGRYRLTETVRQYNRDRLAESGEAGAVRGRHQDHFLALAEEAEPKLRGAEQQVWLDRLETEHDNLRAALTWSRGEAGAVPLRLAGALGMFWRMRGHWSEGRNRLAAALDAAGAEAAPVARAKSLHVLGHLTDCLGDHVAAEAWLNEALALRRQIGDPRGVAWTLMMLGHASAQRGDYAKARVLYGECLALGRGLGDSVLIGGVFSSLGLVAACEGNDTEAKALHEESLALLQPGGNPWYIAEDLKNLGGIALRQGDAAGAGVRLEEGLAIFRRLGAQAGIAECLSGLAAVAELQGDPAKARAHYAESLSLRRRLGHPSAVVSALNGLASVAGTQGQSARAARLCGAAAPHEAAVPLSPYERNSHEQITLAARAALGEEAFASAWAEGRAMTWEQAIEYALSEENEVR